MDPSTLEQWTDYMKFLVGLAAIVNPIGAVPIFINLTAGQGAAERRRTGLMAAAASAAVLLVALVAGQALLAFFGISIASFRVGGGILLLLMAISMLHAHVSPARQTAEEAVDSAERSTLAVVPLGMPLLAGPGAISTVILYAQRGHGPSHYLVLVGAIAVIFLLVWACLRAAEFLAGLLGRTGINVVTRIMGLILAAISVEFMTTGLRELLPGLG